MHRLSLVFLFLALCVLVSCENSDADSGNLDLDELYRELGVEGAFLLRSLGTDQLYTYNPRRCEQGFLPASTFKIVNAMIALEEGVAKDANHYFPWDSIPRSMAAWNQDHNLKSGFQVSCVPCYQALARTIGVERMQAGVQKLNYGRMDIREETLANFWLVGKSEITPYQQLDFMTRLAKGELPISDRTEGIVKDMMILAKDDAGFVMRGKTGWAIVEDRNIGWFVGIIERGDGEQFVFVNNVEAPIGSLPDDAFMASRKRIVGAVLERLEVI